MNTPYYLIDEAALRRNLEILRGVRERTGCRILLAQKAFSMFAVYPIIAEYLDGATASGLFEARLAAEELQGENHVFSAAYRAEDIPELARLCDHVVFNSCAQLRAYAPQVLAAGKQAGLRINPDCSTQEGHAIYDPCGEKSRLGVTRAQFDPEVLPLLSGLHFHTLCEQDSDALATTLDAVAQKFGDLLPRMQWLNFGGGHHITRPGYDIAMLERCITRAQQDWGVTVYLEPGEACALNAGFLLSRVLDVVQNGDTTIAILDASAACHMPDVIEMPYRPPLFAAAEPGERPCTVRLAGPTCLAGDVIGDYGVDAVPNVGDLLVFGDMAIYTTCKNNTFNGMPLPAIFARAASGTTRSIVSFGYEDFKYRLGKR
mgnify:CR=1 FL=1